MKTKDLQWLLSLSILSLLGPKCDVDYLTSQGYYKKNNGEKPELLLNISAEENSIVEFKEDIHSFLDIMNVFDKDSFRNRIKELVRGSSFSNNMDKMMLLGKMMSKDVSASKKSMTINGHPYHKSIFNDLMMNEFRWPKEGLKAYDTANAVMLLRLGIELGYLIEEEQNIFINQLRDKYKDDFTNYKNFCRDCQIGRSLHVSHLKSIRDQDLKEDQTQLVSIAYFGILQYFETNK